MKVEFRFFVAAALLFGLKRLSGGVYHPEVSDGPITRGRRHLVFLMLLVFVA